jgi:hypothetical protein
MKKTVSGIIKLPGWSFHFNLEGGMMKVETRVPRKHTDEEEAAIADAVKHLNTTLSILSERVDMTDAAKENGIEDLADQLLSLDERDAFEDFVKGLAKKFEENGEKKPHNPFDDIFKKR